jgi:hypothetical protein
MRLRPLLLSGLALLAWAGIGLSPADQRAGWDASGVRIGGRTPVEAPAADDGRRWRPALWGQANARIIAGGERLVPAWCEDAIACWDMAGAADEAGALVDLSGNNRTLTRVGTTSWSAGTGIGTTADAGWITTPVVPGLDSTIIVRTGSCTAASGRSLFGARSSSPTSRWTSVYFGSGGPPPIAAAWGTATPASVMASPENTVIAIGNGYLIRASSVIRAWTPAGTSPTHAVYLGAQNTDGTATAGVTCTVRSAGIWAPGLSSADAITRAAMLP